MFLALLVVVSVQAAPSHLNLLPSDEVGLELSRLEAARGSLVPSLIASGVGVAASATALALLFSSVGFEASIVMLLAGPVVATIGLTLLVATIVRNAALESRAAELRQTATRAASLGAMAREDLSQLRMGELAARSSLALPVILLVSGTVIIPVGGFIGLYGLVASVTALVLGPVIVLVGLALLTAGIASMVAVITDNAASANLVRRIDAVQAAAPVSATFAPLPGLRLAAF